MCACRNTKFALLFYCIVLKIDCKVKGKQNIITKIKCKKNLSELFMG